MNTRQIIVDKLKSNGLNISGNQLEYFIYEYKKKYNNQFKGIDLMFDMLDDNEEFLKFVNFIKAYNETNNCESEEHFTIITCFSCNRRCEKKEQVAACSSKIN